ncbi:hypothetical protein GCM10017783_22350 [Deinococcus piscis]|uniref:site-specific DNA-methyltransferase (adenine-specific) n=1 Tax=Deinococcus piscis TaxID=394230 RepID=A0ABQ3KAR1_9DEIO|nr:type ISP restriction/modification enzyme [Deinococcus piscis]GHG09348.1 hypothetical protein GCM10017783_22350 [Deinococcus piscis]
MNSQNHLETYANAVRDKYSTGVAANPEDQLKTPIENLLRAVLPPLVSDDLALQVLTEVQDNVGRPDVGITLGGILAGHLELKAPDKPADPNKLKGHDKNQWQKFQALPNLIYTNGKEWRLFQRVDDGKSIVLTSVGKPVKLGDIVEDGAAAITPAAAAEFETLLRAFVSWQPITPSTPRKLASLIAPLTRILRDDVAAALRTEGSNVHEIAKDWRNTLFPEADDARFADAYAQTITYALLLAKLEGSKDSDHAAATLKAAHPLLADILKLLTNDALTDELGVGFLVLRRLVDSLDLSTFEGQGDPWIYFYEDFLAEYDPTLRNAYGVYYTPQEVIAFQVRLADELLKTHLGKARGLAHDGVILLDPATGTGAYPLHIIEYATNQYAKYGKGTIATRLAHQIHAIEILVGAYTVAHLRVTQAINSAGGSLPEGGAQVYLSNTLDSPHAEIPGNLGFVYKPLTEERKRVQRLKRDVPVMVCLGNPPYYRWPAEDSKNEVYYGGWVRHGDKVTAKEKKEGIRAKAPLLDTFTDPVKKAGMGSYLHNLYNDYVAFWRWAMWKVFENEHDPRSQEDRAGIVSFITASSYLRGPAFGGMREHMRRTFDELWIVDLGGEGRGAVKTENVFAIQTPVCIAMGVRNGKPNPDQPATVKYVRVEGCREEKLAWLTEQKQLSDVEWTLCPDGWQDSLMPRGEGDYWAWPLLSEIFPEQFNGVKAGRTWPIGETELLLRKRWQTLIQSSAEHREALVKSSNTGQKVTSRGSIKALPKAASSTPLISVDSTDREPEIVRFGMRSFDRMWIFSDSRVLDRASPELWKSHGRLQIYAVSFLTEHQSIGPSIVASAYIPDIHHFRGSFGGRHVIPLYLDAEATQPNIRPGLLEYVSELHGQPVTAEDVFAYAYALLSSPTYEERFREDLITPGPRLPITRDGELFAKVATAGRELLHLHTYGERMGTGPMPEGEAGILTDIPGDPARYPEDFSYDEEQNLLRVGAGEVGPVPPEVWEFEVSGLRPLRSWLGYRMKKPAGKQSGELSKIRPERWTPELTEELLELIWLLEGTVERQPQLAGLLDEVLSDGEAGTLLASELPAIQEEVELEELEGTLLNVQVQRKR